LSKSYNLGSLLKSFVELFGKRADLIITGVANHKLVIFNFAKAISKDLLLGIHTVQFCFEMRYFSFREVKDAKSKNPNIFAF
jgi:hypothetical protein